MIEDLLFLKNDTLDKKIVVSISSLPNTELKISEVSTVNKGGVKGKSYLFNPLATSRDEFNLDSFKHLSNNPLNNSYICSGGVINTNASDGTSFGHNEQGILIWKLD